MPNVASADVRSFYDATLECLRYVESRAPTQRRFGPDADALWKQLGGHLATADRLDLLLGDADAQWPGAFAARVAFDARGVAADDALGPSWPGLPAVHADELWRAVLARPGPGSLAAALAACAASWNVSLAPFDVEAVEPTTRLLVAGPSAVAAVAQAFAGRGDLDWPAQVEVVASRPAHRHTAALVAALLNTTRPTRFWSGAASAGAGPSRRPVVSPDADPRDAARVAAGAAAAAVPV